PSLPLPSFPTRRSSDLCSKQVGQTTTDVNGLYSFRDIPPGEYVPAVRVSKQAVFVMQKQTLGKVIAEAVKYTVAPGQTLVVPDRSEEHTSELQSRSDLV